MGRKNWSVREGSLPSRIGNSAHNRLKKVTRGHRFCAAVRAVASQGTRVRVVDGDCCFLLRYEILVFPVCYSKVYFIQAHADWNKSILIKARYNVRLDGVWRVTFSWVWRGRVKLMRSIWPFVCLLVNSTMRSRVYTALTCKTHTIFTPNVLHSPYLLI